MNLLQKLRMLHTEYDGYVKYGVGGDTDLDGLAEETRDILELAIKALEPPHGRSD